MRLLIKFLRVVDRATQHACRMQESQLAAENVVDDADVKIPTWEDDS